MRLENPIAAIAERRGFFLLDGALATELEARGADLGDTLWSARLLVDDPDAIRAVHRAYLDAGADCIATASYQASVPGFVRAGLSRAAAQDAIERSVRLALDARADASRDALIAGSLGPYGTLLADGSEYTGVYGATEAELERFHRERIEAIHGALRDAGESPVLLAFETIPSLAEAELLTRIVASLDDAVAWISFSCRDERTTCAGDPIEDCGAALERCDAIVAIGVNCTDPRFVTSLVRRLASATTKPILAYPNSGEVYDARDKRWTGTSVMHAPASHAREWLEAGAAGLGGCCRTTPDDIAALAHLR